MHIAGTLSPLPKDCFWSQYNQIPSQFPHQRRVETEKNKQTCKFPHSNIIISKKEAIPGNAYTIRTKQHLLTLGPLTCQVNAK